MKVERMHLTASKVRAGKKIIVQVQTLSVWALGLEYLRS